MKWQLFYPGFNAFEPEGKNKFWDLFYSLIWINSLAPGKIEWNFRHVIFKQILYIVIDGWRICCEIALIWMSLDFTVTDELTLIPKWIIKHIPIKMWYAIT